MTWLFNPFSGDITPAGSTTSNVVESAVKLKATYVASETISALRCINLISEIECKNGSDVSYEDARITGISLTSGNTGQSVDVQTFGILEDAFFTFPIYAPLFCGANGEITSNSTGNFLTQIGHSLGVGAIFINIRETIEQGS